MDTLPNVVALLEIVVTGARVSERACAATKETLAGLTLEAEAARADERW